LKKKTKSPIESLCWRALACSEAPASCHASAPCYRQTEDVLSLAVIEPELKLVQVQRQILGAEGFDTADLKDAKTLLYELAG
jgi:hypothetical protein